MEYHPNKCLELKITKKRKIVDLYFNIHGHILENVYSTKYLDTTFQSDSKWTDHIKHIHVSSKANLSCVETLKLIQKLKTKIIILVRQKLEYCSTVWDGDNLG